MKAYVSILGWPDDMSQATRLEILVAATGLDPHTAKQRLARGTPQVTMLTEATLVPSILSVLRNAGVTAFAPTDDDLAADPAPPPRQTTR